MPDAGCSFVRLEALKDVESLEDVEDIEGKRALFTTKVAPNDRSITSAISALFPAFGFLINQGNCWSGLSLEL
jgi:hypothetical protein